jgi:hypothetical protein
MIVKDELRYWAGLLGSVAMAIIGAVAVPHPYDKWLMAAGAACMAMSTYQMTPPSKE